MTHPEAKPHPVWGLAPYAGWFEDYVDPLQAEPSRTLLVQAQTAGWMLGDLTPHDPYQRGERRYAFTLTKGPLVVECSGAVLRGCCVHPRWFKPGRTIGFVVWTSLNDVLTRLERSQ